jgi:hypothetical protein
MRARPFVSLALLLSVTGCETGVPAALGTSVGQPLLVGLEDGTELNVGSREGSALRLQVDSAGGDTAYHTNWSLREDTCLQVVPRVGEAVLLRGAPLAVSYYHVGRVLEVSIGPRDNPALSSFVDPIRFSTTPCPAAGP